MSRGVPIAIGSQLKSTSLDVARVVLDKAGRAAAFLRASGGGVMDLIAHFWDRLPQTPPLARDDLHLLVALRATDGSSPPAGPDIDFSTISGAMLYVPKAHRADVLALNTEAAEAFSMYLSGWERLFRAKEDKLKGVESGSADKLPDYYIPINYITGEATGVDAMLPHLLALVNKKAPARKTVNVVMHFPAENVAQRSDRVRQAKNGDEAVLNRWRKLYNQERGILFDADVDAWISSGNVFVYELDKQIVGAAKFDLTLPNMIEIGGVFTFPDFRKRGIGAELVLDLVARIRMMGKTPSLQVDVTNVAALSIYQKAGWQIGGSLARVWLSEAR